MSRIIESRVGRCRGTVGERRGEEGQGLTGKIGIITLESNNYGV
jgi:hypothetical protein